MTAEEFIRDFRELRLKMPKVSLSGYQNQNCPYASAVYNSKNCYLCFDCDSSENCLYCGMTTRNRFCADCEDIWDCELCYESSKLYNCYNCDFSYFLRDCSDCAHCEDCLNCHNCFGCVGLRRANFHIFNKKYSPEEYQNRLKFSRKQSPAEIKSQIEDLKRICPFVASRQYQTENCFGDVIQNSRNCFFCFDAKGIYDGGYLFDNYNVYGERTEDAYDSTFSVDLHQCYQTVQVGDAWNCNFCHYCEHLRDSEFCDTCFNSRYLFGCTFINRREYLILNTPHEKEQWHKKTAEIKEALKKNGKYDWIVSI